jgi:hypothetical protein
METIYMEGKPAKMGGEVSADYGCSLLYEYFLFSQRIFSTQEKISA